MKSFLDLQVWRKSHQLTLDLYAVTRRFPKEELYGLTSQIRRASSSIPANIAEGCGRSGDNELRRFLEIASGSASEVEYHVILARDLELLGPNDYEKFAQEICEIKRMLYAFIQKLKANR